ncbi:MAG: hypothetical protein ACLP9L_34095 [Thermoguttaceae bacterium]
MQKQISFRRGFALVGVVALAVSGCGGSAIRPMAIASNAGAQAVAKYDANKDGALDYDELAKAPGLQAAVAKIKKLAKGRRAEEPSESQLRSAKITADEIDARIQEWKAHGTGRIKVLCHVSRVGGGRSEPIANAEVKFVPEDFLGTELTTGTGTTDANGNATISQPSRGGSDPARGMSPGFYRVEIIKGTEIPEKYNTATILGQEVAVDAVGISGALQYDLDY